MKGQPMFQGRVSATLRRVAPVFAGFAIVVAVAAIAGWNGAAAAGLSGREDAASGIGAWHDAPPVDAAGTGTGSRAPQTQQQLAGSDPHGAYTLTTSSCAACHRSHTAPADTLLTESAREGALCFSCHDGTGANSNVQAQYTDVNVPANNAATSSFYSHPATSPSSHISGLVDEFAGVLNRHSACADCHNPHTMNSTLAVGTSSGWRASGALAGSAGVSASPAYTWTDPIVYEDELCYKCHSGYTTLLSYSKESYKKTDKLVEFDTANASYHPIEAAGKNTTSQLAASLAGGSRWNTFTTGSTVRCVNCHGDYRAASPAANARLAPHTSRYRGLLIANYRDRDLKSSSQAYAAADFALCYLCHSQAPFSTTSEDPRADTNFRYHGKHLRGISNEGGGGLDIDTLGAGQGNAICAECHYRTHSTKLAPWAGNQDYARGVNFAPNVRPIVGEAAPLWSPVTQTCTLTCHGEKHDPESYAP